MHNPGRGERGSGTPASTTRFVTQKTLGSKAWIWGGNTEPQRTPFPGVPTGARRSPTRGAQHVPGRRDPPRGAPMGAAGGPALPRRIPPLAVRGITEDRREEKPAPAVTQIPLQPDPSLKS